MEPFFLKYKMCKVEQLSLSYVSETRQRVRRSIKESMVALVIEFFKL